MTTSITLKSLLDEINNIKYLEKCCNNNNKDFNSLSYLIDEISLSQSECIKMGLLMEEYVQNIIQLYTNTIETIKKSNAKGKKERDHLFINKSDKIIYYAELKSNLNLDTEKSKSTYKKCLTIVNELQLEYPDYEIKWCLLGIRYIASKSIPSIIFNKYSFIKDNLYGINDYFKMFDIDYYFNEEDYKTLINKIAIKAFKKQDIEKN